MNGDCEYVRDGRDTDGTIWYRCVTHDELAPSKDAPCAGYQEIPYSHARAIAYARPIRTVGRYPHLDTIRVGTIGYTHDIEPHREVRVRVTARGAIGDSDVITYETLDREGGNYVGTLFTTDLMPEPWPDTEARWRAGKWTTVGTYPPFEQSEVSA